MEASSYFSMGVLHDNLDEFEPAIKCYQNFLAVCRRIGDRVGEALAYNSIGVDFQLRGAANPSNPKNWKMAVHYHTKHLSVADEQGQFVAHTNLGLSYASMAKVRADLAYGGGTPVLRSCWCARGGRPSSSHPSPRAT